MNHVKSLVVWRVAQVAFSFLGVWCACFAERATIHEFALLFRDAGASAFIVLLEACFVTAIEAGGLFQSCFRSSMYRYSSISAFHFPVHSNCSSSLTVGMRKISREVPSEAAEIGAGSMSRLELAGFLFESPDAVVLVSIVDVGLDRVQLRLTALRTVYLRIAPSGLLARFRLFSSATAGLSRRAPSGLLRRFGLFSRRCQQRFLPFAAKPPLQPGGEAAVAQKPAGAVQACRVRAERLSRDRRAR